MKDVYEVIHFRGTNFKFSMTRRNYIIPHLHREMEVGLLLEGKLNIFSGGRAISVQEGDFWILNSMQCHENKSADPNHPYVSLVLQIPASFFKEYFPQMGRITMNSMVLKPETVGEEACRVLQERLLESAMSFFRQDRNYELFCAGNINFIYKILLDHVPFVLLMEEEIKTLNTHLGRIQRITDYIEEHYGEKLLLSEIAEKESLALNYLSHSFKDYFGMPFQTYLQNFRCQKACGMLLDSDNTLSDISYACGFSALKYMNKAFQELFGMDPKEYRSRFRTERLVPISKQDKENPWLHFSREECVAYLENFVRK